MRTSIKLFSAALVAATLSLPFLQGAQATTPTAKYRVAIICYVGDPQIVVVATGNWTFGQSAQIVCEAGDSGAGAYLYYKINGAGIGWFVKHSDGATLQLNSMGTLIHMPAQYVNHHIYCPKKSFTDNFAISCQKSIWGYPGERAADGT